MAVNFPSSPSEGDTYSSDDRNWQFDGSMWRARPNIALDAVPVANGGTGVKTIGGIYDAFGDPMLTIIESGDLDTGGVTHNFDATAWDGWDDIEIMIVGMEQDSASASEVSIRIGIDGDVKVGGSDYLVGGSFINESAGTAQRNSNSYQSFYRMAGSIDNAYSSGLIFHHKFYNLKGQNGNLPLIEGYHVKMVSGASTMGFNAGRIAEGFAGGVVTTIQYYMNLGANIDAGKYVIYGVRRVNQT